ncbi:MAG TPA: aminoacyl-tRNA hydrolase [Alphaproteobacteria bacterium]|nr:aminoacyl-tRNA hydrolase [Alphaproteobacteria bacterium]
MHLIVGLGNPGKLYAKTRHNVGWMVLDAIADKYGFGGWTKKFKGEYATGDIDGQKAVLLKPHTYMNISGESVQPAALFYKTPPAHVLVVHDDIDLGFLALKHKIGGGDAGHNGLKSITQSFGTPDYRRLRIGVGRPVHGDVADFVLQNFGKDEAPRVADVCTLLADKFSTILNNPSDFLATYKQ